MSIIHLVGVLLGGVAGIGTFATAIGFAMLTARLVAAELPVVDGLDLFGLRSAIATGARTLAFPVLVGAFAGPLVGAVAWERRRRELAEDRDRDQSVRGVTLVLTIVNWATVALLLLFAVTWRLMLSCRVLPGRCRNLCGPRRSRLLLFGLTARIDRPTRARDGFG